MTTSGFASQHDCFTLANGVRVPCIGYGTWQTAPGQVPRCPGEGRRAPGTGVPGAESGQRR